MESFPKPRRVTIKEPRVNRRIQSREVRVINEEGEQLGILQIRQALEMAEETGLDLVEVAPQAKPPVCKLMDYGKYKYQQKQKTKEAKRNATQIQVKEVKLRPKTDEHDILTKIRHIRRFLNEGDKAKITVMFRGREITHKDRGLILLERIQSELLEDANVELPPKMEGRTMIMILASKLAKKDARIKKKSSRSDQDGDLGDLDDLDLEEDLEDLEDLDDDLDDDDLEEDLDETGDDDQDEHPKR